MWKNFANIRYFLLMVLIKIKSDYKFTLDQSTGDDSIPISADLDFYANGGFDLLKIPTVLYATSWGFFANYLGVLGYLDICEKNGYTPRILFDSGNYFDAKVGPNWWEYYFEKVSLVGNKNKYIIKYRDNSILGSFGLYARSFLSLRRKNEILKKYIRVKKEIIDEVDKFIRDEFESYFVLGCHIRGTDKITETGYRYSIETIKEEIDKIVSNKDNYRIFLATEDLEYYSELKKIYKDKLISRDSPRLNEPIFLKKEYQGYSIGKDVLIDCMILSNCKYFLGSTSNVSHAVLVFNPKIDYHIIKVKEHDRTRIF